jgi:endonuclease YncB( thermonuclease family)
MRTAFLLALCLTASATAQAPAPQPPRPSPSPQPRTHGTRVSVPADLVSVDDGDTVQIRWARADVEIVRILGIDTPETRHLEHDLPFDQAFGPEARAFARGAFAAAKSIELTRAGTLDPFGRTLGYLHLNGTNYSLLVVAAGLAEESVSRYGDNGIPREAAEVLAAAKAAGPPPFESPGAFRARMRDVTKAMKARGEYPQN